MRNVFDKQMRQRLLSNRSLALCQGKRFQEALEDADQAIEDRPGWDKAWFRRGSAQIGLQQLPAAVQSFRKSFYLSKGKAPCPDDQPLYPGSKTATRHHSGVIAKSIGISTVASAAVLLVFPPS